MTTELKPCPFCGGKARIRPEHIGNHNIVCIYCTECHARTKASGRREIIDLWNRGEKLLELRECPLCKYDSAMSIGLCEETFGVICPRCMFQSGPYDSPEAAAEAWNRRVEENS